MMIIIILELDFFLTKNTQQSRNNYETRPPEIWWRLPNPMHRLRISEVGFGNRKVPLTRIAEPQPKLALDKWMRFIFNNHSIDGPTVQVD